MAVVNEHEAEKYLQDNNISHLLQWFTTELILHQPDDPLQFLGNLTNVTTSKDEYNFTPALCVELANESFEKDESQIEREAQELVEGAMSRTRTSLDGSSSPQIANLIASLRNIAKELDPKTANDVIVTETRGGVIAPRMPPA